MNNKDKTLFEIKLRVLIHCQSIENGSNTPDFLLAEYLTRCLENYEKTMQVRDGYHGFHYKKGELTADE